MKLGYIATFLFLGTVLIGCSSDTEPYGEQNAENSYLNTDITQVSFDTDRSATVNVDASKDLSWHVSPSDSWINVDKMSATGSSGISISVNEDNPKTTARIGSVILRSYRYNHSKTISVEQKGTYLSVDKKEVDFPIAGGILNVSVESNASWSVQNTADWIAVSVSRGKPGKTSLTITASSNQKESERTATLVIKADNGALLQLIKIIQTPIILAVGKTDVSAKPEGGQFAIVVTSNTSWTAVSEAGWCTVSPSSGSENGTINLTVSAHTGTTSRSTTVYVKSGSVTRSIRVTQDYATLTVDETPITVGPDAYSKTLSVTSNTNWTASSNASWCTVKQSSGQLTINAEKNETDAERTATVTVKALGLTRTVTVTQHKATLTLSPSSTIAFSPEGGSESLKISSNVTWTASSSASWCTLSAVSGTGDKTITVSASENKTGNQRTAKVTVKTGFHTKEIVVSQVNSTLSVSKESLSFGAPQSTTTVTISSNTKWTASCSPVSWLSVNPTSGTGNSTITVKASAASSSSPREGTVTIKAGELTRTIKISQDGVTLGVNPTELSFNVDGGTKTAKVSSNSTVTVSSNASWCTASVSGGTITVTATSNTGNSREATVTVKAGDLTRNVKVTQGGVTLDVSPIELSFAASGGSKTVTATSNVTVSASSNATWCTASVSGSTVTITTTSNAGNSREATVTVKAGILTKSIKVSQGGVTLIVSSTELSFTASGGSKTVTATSNVAIGASSNVTWCTASVSGSTVTIRVTSNNTVSERSATVTIKAGDISRYVRVTQSGGTNIDIDDYPDDSNLN